MPKRACGYPSGGRRRQDIVDGCLYPHGGRHVFDCQLLNQAVHCSLDQCKLRVSRRTVRGARKGAPRLQRHLAAVHVQPRVRDLPGRHPAIAHVGRRDAPEAGGAGLPHHHPQLAVQDVERRLDAGPVSRSERSPHSSSMTARRNSSTCTPLMGVPADKSGSVYAGRLLPAALYA